MILSVSLLCPSPFLFLSLFLHQYKAPGFLEYYHSHICCLFPCNDPIHWLVSSESEMLFLLRSLTIDLTFIFIFISYFIFLFLEQLGLGVISHAVTSVAT